MKMQKPSTSLCWLLAFIVGQLAHQSHGQQAFLDCSSKLEPVLDDTSALDLIKEVHVSKQYKFSSSCLEILLKKNFKKAADYLLESYYPKTQIDTEIILRSVAEDVKRQQDYVLFKLLRARAEKMRTYTPDIPSYPPHVTPMVYQAQSPDHIHFLVRIQEAFDDLDCKTTYEQSVEIMPNQVSVSAVCFESEENVHLFSRTIQLPQAVDPERSYYTWESDGKVHVQLHKSNGPSYWPQLVKLTGESDPDQPNAGKDMIEQKVAMWKLMHNKYIEQVEDYQNSYKRRSTPSDEL